MGNRSRPDRTPRRHIRAQAKRHLSFGHDVFGNLHFSGTADPLQGEVFRNIIDARADELYRADHSAATESGEPPARTNTQRRLDALIGLMADGHGAPPGTKRPEPVLHLVCSCDGDHDHGDGCRQPDGNAHDPTTTPGPVGRRHFTAAQKQLINVQDRHCRHPGCTTRATYCDYDHIIPHARGGPTTVANGQLLCRFHHRWKHRNDHRPNPPALPLD